MAGYTRQAAGNIVTGGVIDAADFNAEYNAIEAAFNASTGHTHDGTIGNGPPIENLGPSADFIVTSSVVRPKTDDTYDFGTPTIEWKDGFFDGTLRTDLLIVDETSTFTGNVTASADVAVSGNLTVTGNATINGNLTLGDAASDSVTFGADIDSNMIPDDDDTFDLGSSTKQWRDLYIDGTANIDSLVADTADINGGSIDGATIGAAATAAITGTTITGTSLVGPVTGNVTGNVTGTVSDISNHNTDSLSEGSSNLYFTDARARAAISAGEGIDISSGQISGENATTSNKGIASFNSTDFTVSSGAVSLKDESIQDIVGAMVSGNTETNISVTYNDSTGKLNFSSTDTNTTYSADGNYGMTLSGTTFRLEDDRRRNSSTADVYSGNTHDYTFYDASVGIRWYTAGAEEMRLDNSGNLHVDANITAYSTTVSDIRLKENVKEIKEPLAKLGKLQGYEFTYKKGGKKALGVIAQEVEKVIPTAVALTEMPFHSPDPENPEKFLGVEYDQVIGLLVSAVNELKAELDELKGKLREV